MLYQRHTFTCPASHNTDELKWDFAFLTKDEFITKHGEKAYATFSNGKNRDGGSGVHLPKTR